MNQPEFEQQTQEVLYRRWRPRTFNDVVGQAAITTTLRNAVASGSPAHAYLLTGPRGTGKTSVGRIMAKAVNCAAPLDGEPDGTCPSCVMYDAGQALDLIELDAASNRGIDEVRSLRDAAGYAPTSGRFKIYLVDEVHMLTDAAFNALLKTLEEPPPHVIFILATTEPHRIPVTITSRCQRFDFRRHKQADVVERLAQICSAEGFQVDVAGLELIAREATGSLRDAVNLLDQAVAYFGTTLDVAAMQTALGLVVDARAATLARAAVQRDLRAGLEVLGSARDDGIEIRAFMREVVTYLRRAMQMQAGIEDLPLSDSELEELGAVVSQARIEDIVGALRSLADIDFAGDSYDVLPAEIAFAAHALGQAETAAAPAPPAQPQRGAPERRAPRQQPRAPGAAGAPSSGAAGQAPAAPPAGRRERPPAAQPSAGASDSASTAAPVIAPVPSAAAPKPPPAPFEPPADGGDGEVLERLRERWDAMREHARKLHFRAGALLNAAYPRSADEQRVVLGFRYANHVDMVREADGGRVLEVIEQAVREAIGLDVTVEAEQWEALQEAAPVPAAKQSGGHLVAEAQKLGATPVEE